jgi:hypothetical protein
VQQQSPQGAEWPGLVKRQETRMQSAENSSDVRCLTYAELDNVGGGHPAAILAIGALTAIGMAIGDAWEPDLGAKVPSWYNTMI